MINICKILRVCRATSLLVSDVHVSLLNLARLQNVFKTLFLAVSTNICELVIFKSSKKSWRVLVTFTPQTWMYWTNSQVHRYDTRTATNYRVHSCRTNIKKFTILYQGPRIWNCLPASVTNLSSFSVFKNKVLEFLLKQLLNQFSRTSSQPLFLIILRCRGGLSLLAWWFLEVSSPNNLLYPVKFAVKKRLINDDDDDEVFLQTLLLRKPTCTNITPK